MFDISNLLFSHPTNVIIVDDNEEYLESLLEGLRAKGLKCIGFSSPKEALSYIFSNPNQYSFSQALKEIDDDSPLSQTTSHLYLDLSHIYKEAFKNKNLNEISVIILDQQMPDIPGDQFASIITDNNIKKLMLTGQLNDQKAIELLSAAIIDSYVEKKITNGIDIIYEKIVALQYRYFLDLNKHFNKIINAKNSILNQQEYKKLINKISSEHKVTEQYLLSKNGSRLFIKNNKEKIWFIVAQKSDFEGWIETASLHDTSPEVMSLLNQRSHLLFLFTEENEMELTPQHWANFLHPANEINIDNEVLYYAVILQNNK